jgi:asparagine synthase (glutamine-hydrolysing)
MRHRGPDDLGILDLPEVPATLGNTRLSILDLSPAGHQPMSFDGGRYWLVHNGEIYNFRELRARLERLGYCFRTETDTEVILAAYSKWGVRCLHEFCGMFAFGLLDLSCPDKPTMFLARDRLGIKPVYYCSKGRSLWFASELAALAETGAVSKHLDRHAVQDYLSLGCVRQPRCIYENIHMLPPGHFMIAGPEGRCDVTCYWDLHQNTVASRQELAGISFADAVQETAKRLEECSRLHMISDRPLGVFLSGGIDSSMAAALISRQAKTKVRSFHVCFNRHTDEREYAQLAAKHIGTEHHELDVSCNDVREMFDRYVKALDQPSVDGLNTWIVAAETSRFVPVVITGVGGDELFAGYSHFEEHAMSPEHRSTMGRAVNALAQRASREMFGGPLAFSQLIDFASPRDRLELGRRVVGDASLLWMASSDWWSPDAARRIHEETLSLWRTGDRIQEITYFETYGYLLNMLLRDSDVMTMCHSLELRPMLLDHELAEFVYSLPAHTKRDGQTSKKVLRELAREFLPAEIVQRTKVGFGLPYSEWMKGGLNGYFLSLLDGAHARELLRKMTIASLRKQARQGTMRAIHWSLLILLAWLQATE